MNRRSLFQRILGAIAAPFLPLPKPAHPPYMVKVYYFRDFVPYGNDPSSFSAFPMFTQAM